MAYIVTLTVLGLLMQLALSILAISLGTLFYDTVGPVASGIAVARAAINAAYRVPSKARELVGVRPFLMAEAPAADDSLLAVWDILGTDFRYQPCEGFFPVGGGMLGALNAIETTPMETWFTHIPLKGNETLNIGVEPLSAVAPNGQAGMTMIYSTKRLGRPTIYGLMSREIAAAAAAAAVTAMGGLAARNAMRMHEIIGIASPGVEVVTADQELAGYFTLRCSAWDGVQENRFFHAPLHAIEAGSGVKKIMSIMRLPLDTRFKAKGGTVVAEHYNYDVFDALGELAWGIRWIGT